jgi:hypothetical protein
MRLRELVDVPVKPYDGALKGNGVMPTIGQTQGLWTYDLSVMPPRNVELPSTCRAVGQGVAVWVADNVWASEVTQADVDRIVAALETQTPAHPEQGIVGNNEALFGAPPAYTEGDPVLSVFVYRIASYQQYQFDGLFRREDLAPFNPACRNSSSTYCSNELAMVHVNARNVGSEYMLGVIAHEFSHLAQFGADATEEIWLEESFAELAMVYSGYDDAGNVQSFADDPSQSLVSDAPVSYGAGLLFGSYLHERLGSEGVRAIVDDPLDGIASLLPRIGGEFAPFFGDWGVAMALDEPSLEDGRYGFESYDVPSLAAGQLSEPGERVVTVQPTSTALRTLFWKIPDGQTVQLRFVTESEALRAHVFARTPAQVLALHNGEPLELPPVMAAQRLTVVLSNADPEAAQAVTLTAELVPSTQVVEEEPERVEEALLDEPLPDEAPEDEAKADKAPVDEPVVEPFEPPDSAELDDDLAAQPQPSGDEGGCGCALHRIPVGQGSVVSLILLGLLFFQWRRRV